MLAFRGAILDNVAVAALAAMAEEFDAAAEARQKMIDLLGEGEPSGKLTSDDPPEEKT